MSEWVDVAPVKDFAPGTVRTVQTEGTPIAVFNLNGRYYAIEDLCSHEAETLSDGEVAGGGSICPRPGGRPFVSPRPTPFPPPHQPAGKEKKEAAGGGSGFSRPAGQRSE